MKYTQLLISKHKVQVTPKVKEYIIFKVVKSKLTKFSSEDKLTFEIVKYNEIIHYKFKTMKFIV